MARVIAVYNQKGGVAKTTTCVNLSAYLALEGKKVLLIDFDPQANATSGLGFAPKEIEAGIYHGLFDLADVDRILRPTIFYNYHLIPGSQHLAGALIELVNVPEREYYLKKFIDRIRDRYDYIFIDLPPSLSLLTINGLVAADEILIPVQSQYYSLEGLGQLLEIIDLVNKNISADGLRVSGAVLTMYEDNEELSRDIAKNIEEHFPHHLFATRIPRSSALAEAPSFGRPVILHNPNSEGARAYEQLARELIAQEAAAAAAKAERMQSAPISFAQPETTAAIPEAHIEPPTPHIATDAGPGQPATEPPFRPDYREPADDRNFYF